MGKIIKQREVTLFLVVLLMMITLSITSPIFFKVSNFLSLARSFSIEGIVLIGMTVLLVSGYMDLSVGSVMALSGVFAALLIEAGMPFLIACAGAVAVGLLCGFINGWIITRFKIHPFIITFGMMSIARGIALSITQGQPIRIFNKSFDFIGQASVFGIPLVTVIFLLLVIFFDFCMRKIRFFRQFYFIGGNALSAELTGINVERVRIFGFVLTGFLASISGIFATARFQGAIPTAFNGIELKLIVAAVVGGCTLDGGEGSVLGAVLGIIFLFLLSNGMTLLGVSMYWENFVLGAFLVVVVFFNSSIGRHLEK